MATLEAEPWDDSVRALARYPEMLAWMDENLEWTQQVGVVFLAQPAEVMNAIQRLRTLARANGVLQDTPEQQVVVVEEHIHIVPARAEVIYVPRYDPTIVYVSRPYTYPVSFISFGAAYPAGSWLAYDIDWRFRTFWVVPPPQRVVYWEARPDWRHRYYVTPARPGWREPHWHVWQPVVSRPRYAAPPRSVGARPTPNQAYSPRSHDQTPATRSRADYRPTPRPAEVRDVAPTTTTSPTPAWSGYAPRPAAGDRSDRQPGTDRPEQTRVRPAPTTVESTSAAVGEQRSPARERTMSERWQHRSAPTSMTAPAQVAPRREAPPAPVASAPRPPRERPADVSAPPRVQSGEGHVRPSSPPRPAVESPRPPPVTVSDDDGNSPTSPRRERHR
jgi:hypothetical protein